MKLAVICFTKAGYELLAQLNSVLTKAGFEIDACCKSKAVREAVAEKEKAEDGHYRISKTLRGTDENSNMPVSENGIHFLDISTEEWASEHFAQGHTLLFIGATGIAVRSIASSVKSKLTDPPVLVMDDKGQYVIPILSGHMGGANELAQLIGDKVGALPIITTATDNHQAFAADLFAKKNDLYFHKKEDIARISSKVLAGKKIIMVVEDGAMASDIGQNSSYLAFEERHENEIAVYTEAEWRKVEFDAKNGGKVEGSAGFALKEVENPEMGLNCGKVEENAETGTVWGKVEESAGKCPDLWIGGKCGDLPEDLPRLLPREYVIGIGCKRGKSCAEIEAFVDKCLQSAGLKWEQIRAIASIDRKKDEQGLVELADRRRLSFFTYDADTLNAVPGDFHESEFVRQQMGVGSVCERAAVVCCRCNYGEHGENTASVILPGQSQSDLESGSGYQMVVSKQAEDGITCAIARGKWYLRFRE